MMSAVQGQPGTVAGNGFDVRASLWEATREKAEMLRSMVISEDTVEINESLHYEYLSISSLEESEKGAKDTIRDLLGGLPRGRALGTAFPKGQAGGLALGQVPMENFEGRSYEKVVFKMEYAFEATYSRNYTSNVKNAVGISQTKLDELKEYFSPENTSERIVDFATSFFGMYLENHADDGTTVQEQLNDFMELVKGAIDKGFDRAREILGNMPKPVEDTMNETYDLVQLKLDAWKEGQMALVSPDSFIDNEEELPSLEEMIPVPELESVGVSQRAFEGGDSPAS